MPAVGFKIVPKAGSSGVKLARRRRPDGSVGGARKRPQHVLGDLQRHQPGVLVLVHVEDDRSRHGVQDVATGQMAVRLQEHLQRKSHVQQADPPRRVPGVHARRMRRALGQQRARRRILDSAGGVVGDLLGGLMKLLACARPGNTSRQYDRRSPAAGSRPSAPPTNCRNRVSRASASNQRRSKVELSIGFMGERSPRAKPPILIMTIAFRPYASAMGVREFRKGG